MSSMKRIFFLMMCTISLAGTCKKDDNCHKEIAIKNLSDYDLIIARRSTSEGKCMLVGNGYTITKKSEISYKAFQSCIERKVSNDIPLEIYLVNFNKFNEGLNFYSCDSIYIKNHVLKKYTLTLDTLIQTDFTIVYQ